MINHEELQMHCWMMIMVPHLHFLASEINILHSCLFARSLAGPLTHAPFHSFVICLTRSVSPNCLQTPIVLGASSTRVKTREEKRCSQSPSILLSLCNQRNSECTLAGSHDIWAFHSDFSLARSLAHSPAWAGSSNCRNGGQENEAGGKKYVNDEEDDKTGLMESPSIRLFDEYWLFSIPPLFGDKLNQLSSDQQTAQPLLSL